MLLIAIPILCWIPLSLFSNNTLHLIPFSEPPESRKIPIVLKKKRFCGQTNPLVTSLTSCSLMTTLLPTVYSAYCNYLVLAPCQTHVGYNTASLFAGSYNQVALLHYVNNGLMMLFSRNCLRFYHNYLCKAALLESDTTSRMQRC